jgi:hypothetical protein
MVFMSLIRGRGFFFSLIAKRPTLLQKDFFHPQNLFQFLDSGLEPFLFFQQNRLLRIHALAGTPPRVVLQRGSQTRQRPILPLVIRLAGDPHLLGRFGGGLLIAQHLNDQ